MVLVGVSLGGYGGRWIEFLAECYCWFILLDVCVCVVVIWDFAVKVLDTIRYFLWYGFM